jgi:hypothetical protein
MAVCAWVVEIIQSTQAKFSNAVPQAGSFPFRAGVTLIVEAPKPKSRQQPVDVAPKVRFAIGRKMIGPDAKQREEKQRSFFIAQGLAVGNTEEATWYEAIGLRSVRSNQTSRLVKSYQSYPKASHRPTMTYISIMNSSPFINTKPATGGGGLNP